MLKWLGNGGEIGESWRQTAVAWVFQFRNTLKNSDFTLKGRKCVLFLSKNVFFLTNGVGFIFSNLSSYLSNFGLLSCSRNFFEISQNICQQLLSSCLKEFLRASKVSDDWLRKGKKRSHKRALFMEDALLKKKSYWRLQRVGEECSCSTLE